MPTPFSHLAIAHELLDAPPLAPALRASLHAHWPAFLLGNIAPDVQTITGQPREATHFFPVPLDGAPPATSTLLARYPALAWARLPAANAAFMAGYLAHLVFDQAWVREIFEPIFGAAQTWNSFRERLYLHNVLRAYWDAEDLARLGPGVAASLAAAQPSGWLPFVDDAALGRWRDLVAGQLSTPGAARTVEVFAARMGADPAAFAALLASPEEMERQVFARCPPPRLAAYRARALAASLDVLQAYWRGEHPPPPL